jgi:tRNA pseudouridine synthase
MQWHSTAHRQARLLQLVQARPNETTHFFPVAYPPCGLSPLGSGDMHVSDLIGTAFLYNQVRHIMAVLLLIGVRFESPSVISALLNVDPSALSVHPEDEELPPLVTCKPEYQMADTLPLMLWDCVYDEQDVAWHTDKAGSEGGSVGLHMQLTGLAERAQVEAMLAEHFLAVASQFHMPAPTVMEQGPWDNIAIKKVLQDKWFKVSGDRLSCGPEKVITDPNAYPSSRAVSCRL